MPITSRPAPGTRPANRRALIVEAATELFADRGYENVAMSDIAMAVGVGASALYRHFPRKIEVLAAAVTEVTEEVSRSLESADSVDTALRTLATYSVEHRLAAILWQRESGQLPPEVREPLREQLRALRDHLGAALVRERPALATDHARLLATAAAGAVFSPAFHHATTERTEFEDLLVAIATRVVAIDLPPAPPAAAPTPALTPASRREVVLTAALRLFADRTYASVGVEEIAAEAGMATSSVYLHFSGKADILWAALQRGTGYLQLTLDEVLRTSTDADEALVRLVDLYADFAVGHPELVDALITEVRSLRPEQAEILTTDQREYVGEWVHLYRWRHTELAGATATLVVQAALTVINDVARSAALRSRSDAVAVAAALARAALQLP